MRRISNNLGTAAHIEYLTIEAEKQKIFDGIMPQKSNKPKNKKNKSKRQKRREKKLRDKADAFLPIIDIYETTAEKDRDSGKTFSHQTNRKTSLREDKRIAESMIRCPNNINRAGLYDIITITDEDGEQYTHKLELHDKDVPEVFRLFRGKTNGCTISYKGYTYQLTKILKETSSNINNTQIKNRKKRVVITSTSSPIKHNITSDNIPFLSEKDCLFVYESKLRSCPKCRDKISSLKVNIDTIDNHYFSTKKLLNIQTCTHCNIYFIQRQQYHTLKNSKKVSLIKPHIKSIREI